MQRVIVFFVMAILMLAMPSMMEGLFGSMPVIETASSSGWNNAALSISSQMQSMVSLLGAISYIAGIGFALKGTLALKEFFLYGDYLIEEKPQVIHNENKPEGTDKPIVIEKKIQKPTTLDFEDQEINSKVKLILERSDVLQRNEFVKEDAESSLMMEKSQKEYLIKIWNNYMSLPKHLRNVVNEGKNPRTSTLEQLNLILNAFDLIEEKIVQDAQFKQKVNEKYLKEKVATMG